MRVAVITGAGSGLGSAMADAFAADGMAIAALDIDGDRAAETAARVGNDSVSMRVDVADRESMVAAAKLVDDAFGGCDVVCANVGVQQFGTVERLSEADWRWVMDVNVLGPVNTVYAFLPLLRKREGQRNIVLTSSSSALTPGVRLGAYTASKFAVMGLGEVLRQELEPENIGVSILFPAGMMTRHLESSAEARPTEIGPWVIADDDISTMMASREMADEHIATPEHAVRNLVRDLADNRRYIITHGKYKASIEERFDDVLASFDRMTES